MRIKIQPKMICKHKLKKEEGNVEFEVFEKKKKKKKKFLKMVFDREKKV